MTTWNVNATHSYSTNFKGNHRVPAGTTIITGNCANFTNMDFAGVESLCFTDTLFFTNCRNLPPNMQANRIVLKKCDIVAAQFTVRMTEIEDCPNLTTLKVVKNTALTDRDLINWVRRIAVVDCPVLATFACHPAADGDFSFSKCPDLKKIVDLNCYRLTLIKCGIETVDSSNTINQLTLSKCKNVLYVNSVSEMIRTQHCRFVAAKNTLVVFEAKQVDIEYCTGLKSIYVRKASEINMTCNVTKMAVDGKGIVEFNVISPSLKTLVISSLRERQDEFLIIARNLKDFECGKLNAKTLSLDIGSAKVDFDPADSEFLRVNAESNSDFLNVSSKRRNACVVKTRQKDKENKPVFKYYISGYSVRQDKILEAPEFTYNGKLKRKIELFTATT